MFKGHPKGLFVLALANMGERFGFYTMVAIFALYLQAKFGLTSGTTSQIYGIFLAFVYFFPLLGGIIADKFLGYGKTIMLGIIVMFGGYILLATPSEANTIGYIMLFGALFLISFGTGLFKGNLQALVGNLYDQANFSGKRDIAFSIFYMCINIGAFFAPNAAEGVSNFFLEKDGFRYEAEVPNMALKYSNFTVVDSTTFVTGIVTELEEKGKSTAELKVKKAVQETRKKEGVIYTTEKERITRNLEKFGKEQQGKNFVSVEDYSTTYISSLGKSYNWGFGVACISLIISLMIFIGFRKTYKAVDLSEAQKAKDENKKDDMIILTPKQVKDRLIALGLVFFVVIFFWMSFHQNGLCMTFFARDYTRLSISPFENLEFSLFSLIPFIIGFYGLFVLITNKKSINKFIGFIFALGAAFAIYSYYQYSLTGHEGIVQNGAASITPQKFQQFNPLFIILLTPIFVGLFGYLNKIGKEPSAPKKIGIGMVIASIGFIFLVIPSIGLQSPLELGGAVSSQLVSPNWLVSTYFVLTLAELFLSPMGISFVSKVSPPQYKGLMQGGWLAATAVGNYLVGVMGEFWDDLSLVQFWSILLTCCLLSAIFIFSILKRLERASS